MEAARASALVVAVFLAATGGTALSGCKEQAPTVQPAVLPAGAVLIHFKVEGMHCHGCAASVRNAISKIQGVRRCNVSFDEASAEVVMDTVDEDDIIAKIIEAVVEQGFTIQRLDS